MISFPTERRLFFKAELTFEAEEANQARIKLASWTPEQAATEQDIHRMVDIPPPGTRINCRGQDKSGATPCTNKHVQIDGSSINWEWNSSWKVPD